MRTTIDIDDPILKQVKRLQKRQSKSLGRVVSELLAQSLAQTDKPSTREATFHWTSKPMNARVNLADKHALLDVMDGASR